MAKEADVEEDRRPALLADIVDRGLDYSGGLLVVIDGAKALASATRKVFGDPALVQRCQIHDGGEGSLTGGRWIPATTPDERRTLHPINVGGDVKGSSGVEVGSY